MRVSHLSLEDFRSYTTADMTLAEGTTAFVGPNGAGKTNLLEAIHLIARGDSPRASDDADMVRWGAAAARVRVQMVRAEGPLKVEIVLFSAPAGERRRPRRYLVDGAGRRAADATQALKVVAFFPEDVQLLADAPSARRRYIDAMLAQVDRAHRTDTREYQRILAQRNALLRELRETAAAPDELAFWDGELVTIAARISARRIAAVAGVRDAFQRASRQFSGVSGGPVLDVAYSSPVEGITVEERETGYRALLDAKREKEMWQGTTLVGPHREDLAVTAEGRPLPTFASRGEQRSAVLALKLAEASWLHERCADLPVFLLDDVLSELDTSRRDALVRAIPEGAQALVTAAVAASVPSALRERATIVGVGETS